MLMIRLEEAATCDWNILINGAASAANKENEIVATPPYLINFRN
jgi:hypothetical protein